MSSLVYSNEFARFGQISYALWARHDIINENYTITLDKRLDGNVTPRVIYPAEVMKVIF